MMRPARESGQVDSVLPSGQTWCPMWATHQGIHRSLMLCPVFGDLRFFSPRLMLGLCLGLVFSEGPSDPSCLCFAVWFLNQIGMFFSGMPVFLASCFLAAVPG